jgi:hypothetical protein
VSVSFRVSEFRFVGVASKSQCFLPGCKIQLDFRYLQIQNGSKWSSKSSKSSKFNLFNLHFNSRELTVFTKNRLAASSTWVGGSRAAIPGTVGNVGTIPTIPKALSMKQNGGESETSETKETL